MEDYMKEFWIKYKWIIIVGLLLVPLFPIALNYVLLIPINAPILGEGNGWLAFWGCYLGAIISSAIAFAILFIQRKDNHQENRNNRQLELNILAYQQQCQWLAELRKAMADYVNLYDENELKEIINFIKFGNIDMVLPKIKKLYDDLTKTDSIIAMIMAENAQRENKHNYKGSFSENQNKLSVMISDLQFLAMMFCYKVPVLNTLADAEFQQRASDNLKRLLQQQNKNVILDYNQIFVIANSIIQPLPAIFEEVRNTAFIYIQEEKTRIDLILEENI